MAIGVRVYCLGWDGGIIAFHSMRILWSLMSYNIGTAEV